MATSKEQNKLTPDEAKAIAKEAYIFNYPLVMYYRTMYLQAIDTQSKSYRGGFGQWLHLGASLPQDTDIVTPSNDTPYSYAWVDLHIARVKPQVLDVLDRDDVIDFIGAEHIHDDIAAAVELHLSRYPEDE